MSRFTGDISLSFGSGLSVRVPNSEYIRPDVTINKDTGALQVNDTQPDVAIISLQGGNADDVIKIGRNFFSAAYIMVNYDAGEFTIWPANQTARQEIVAVDAKGNELDADSLCSSSENATVTAAGTTPSGTSTSRTGTSTAGSASSESSSTPVGAIAGGVVGGVAGIAALALVAFLALRRRRAKSQSPAELDDDRAAGSSPAPMAHLNSPKAESATASSYHSAPFHELSPESLTELPPTERGGRRELWHSDAPPRYELPGNNTVVHEM